jgi:hypothetical protein
MQEVWGPPSRQRRLREIVRRGAAGSGVGAALNALDCGLTGGDSLGAAILAIVIAGLLFIAIGYLVDKVRDRRRRRSVVRPYGAVTRPALPSRENALLGMATGTTRPSPLHDEPCLAFSIVLRATGHRTTRSDVMWQDAYTAGFRIQRDDSAMVHIPAGRIRIIESPSAKHRAAREKAAAYLPAGLGVDVDGELSELPFDRASEEIVRPNQRIAILSRVELREDPDHPPASLRAPANLAWVAVGVPVLSNVS